MDRATTHPRTLFLTDNGRCLCGSHLGSAARFTGRDISGQRIQKLRPTDAEAIRADYAGWLPSCEECGLSLEGAA